MRTPQPQDPIKLINRALIDKLLEEAGENERRRVNFNFHPTLEDNPHRFLNVLLRGTYITPHRHLHPPKAESFLILEGKAVFLIFGESGEVEEVHPLVGYGISTQSGAANLGVDIAPGIWHTLVVLSPHAVIYEVKPGPYLPTADKEFAPWAPVEGSPECADYLARLIQMLA